MQSLQQLRLALQGLQQAERMLLEAANSQSIVRVAGSEQESAASLANRQVTQAVNTIQSAINNAQAVVNSLGGSNEPSHVDY